MEEIVSRAADALDNFQSKLMSSDQTGEALRSLSSAMQNLDSILKSVNTDLPGLVTDLRKEMIKISQHLWRKQISFYSQLIRVSAH